MSKKEGGGGGGGGGGENGGCFQLELSWKHQHLS